MSSILKALRKLENEKADMGEGSVDLARDILKRSYEEPSSQSLWMIAALAVVAVLLGAGWWWFSPTKLAPQATVSVERPVTATISASSTVVKPSIMPEAPVAAKAIAQAEATVAVPQQQLLPVTHKVPVAVGRSVADPIIKASENPLIIPDFVIEEIIFVEDATARLAVINDLPVMQGTAIEGARVIEIYPNKVRFEYRGIRFNKFKTR